MSRIVYLVFGTGTPRGGHKVAFRHVEALNHLGFDATVWLPEGTSIPQWLNHAARVQVGGAFLEDDVIVFPEDAVNAMRHFSSISQRRVVFCQNHIYAASQGVGTLSPSEIARFDDFMACSETVAQWLAKFMPHRCIEVVPAFADERSFHPSSKSMYVACSVGKRPLEFRAVQTMLPKLHTSTVHWRWAVLKDKTEQEVAVVMGNAAIFLSLSRFEGLGITTLEAMAAGCLVVGFPGIGGLEYARPTNGFWVADDDLESCARSLAQAMALVEVDHSVVEHMRTAARATAAEYSYARFVGALEKFWTKRVVRVQPSQR